MSTLQKKTRVAKAPKAAKPLQSAQTLSLSAESLSTKSTLPAHITTEKFIDLEQVNPVLINNLQRKGLTNLTQVQAATINPVLAGIDAVVQARTGTGKTVAFLLPSLHKLLSLKPKTVNLLVVTPTRELAIQIVDEATDLLKGTGVFAMTAVGGTSMTKDVNSLKRGNISVLISTPGRLTALLEGMQLESCFSNISTVILDEADRLLDDGFKRDLDKIFELINRLSPKPRQTLLFSATVPKEVFAIAQLVLRKGYANICTVPVDEAGTHEHVTQCSMIVPDYAQVPAALLTLLEIENKTNPICKSIVFFPTANMTKLYSELFKRLGLNVMELHSRMSQPARTKTTESFRDCSNGFLFSSDVAARGMDFPGVTTVYQVGLPSGVDQYIHRLGRTARGTSFIGGGLILLVECEQWFLKDLGALNVVPFSGTSDIISNLAPVHDRVNIAFSTISPDIKNKAYAAWLGFHNTLCKKMGWSKAKMVEVANAIAASYGCTSVPGLSRKAVGLMGLKGVPGIVVETSDTQAGNRSSNGAQGGGSQHGNFSGTSAVRGRARRGRGRGK